MEIGFRPLSVEDHPFMFSTWLRTYKEKSNFAQWIRHPVFYEWHPKILNALINRPSVSGIVAHTKQEPGAILGYLISETKPERMNTIHFIFVKDHFRKFGIATKLIEHSFPRIKVESAEYTHHTFDLDRYLTKHPESRDIFIYNPYSI